MIATVTELPLLFNVHKIWLVSSQENHSNCCHQMSDFMAKSTKFDFGAYSAPSDPLAGFKGPTSKGREGKVGKGKGRDGREGTGKEGKGGQKSNPPVKISQTQPCQ